MKACKQDCRDSKRKKKIYLVERLIYLGLIYYHYNFPLSLQVKRPLHFGAL